MSPAHIDDIRRSIFQLYEEIFEAPFLKATGDYYREEAQKLLQEGKEKETLLISNVRNIN